MKKISILLVMILLFSFFVFASTYIDDGSSGGTFVRTFYNASTPAIQLNATYNNGTYSNGTTIAGTTWNNVSYWRGYGYELCLEVEAVLMKE